MATLLPDSALINKAEYEYASEKLTLTLNDGRRYRAYRVPATKWRAMRKAKSVGRYFNGSIKGVHTVRALKPAS